MILEVRNLSIEFPTRRGTLVAVEGISFSIAPGEVLGVVGESGAGKSITGAAVIGLLDPPGRIASGESSVEELGWELFHYYLDVASGRKKTWAEVHRIHNHLALFNPAPLT